MAKKIKTKYTTVYTFKKEKFKVGVALINPCALDILL